MNFILFDDTLRIRFLPLTYTRPVAELMTGMFTMRQRWEKYLHVKMSVLTEAYLQELFPLVRKEENLLINARVLPSGSLVKEIMQLKNNEKLMSAGTVVAMRLSGDDLAKALGGPEHTTKNARLVFDLKVNLSVVKSACQLKSMDRVWHLFTMSGEVFDDDLVLLDENAFQSLDPEGCQLFGKRHLIHSTAVVKAASINSENGPVVIDEGAEIMEGCHLRGPIYIGKGAVVKMGTRIYGPVTIGPESRVGGEISTSVVHGYSNKGHDGFMGQTVIGEWCNLGADTNTSNLKNDYGSVKLWDYENHDLMDTGEQFLGLVMGDHSKCGINTMFNTGTIIGVCTNVFGAGFPPKFIPSFSWGGNDRLTTFRLEKALEVGERMMERRKQKLGEKQKELLRYVFDLTASLRHPVD